MLISCDNASICLPYSLQATKNKWRARTIRGISIWTTASHWHCFWFWLESMRSPFSSHLISYACWIIRNCHVVRKRLVFRLGLVNEGIWGMSQHVAKAMFYGSLGWTSSAVLALHVLDETPQYLEGRQGVTSDRRIGSHWVDRLWVNNRSPAFSRVCGRWGDQVTQMLGIHTFNLPRSATLLMRVVTSRWVPGQQHLRLERHENKVNMVEERSRAKPSKICDISRGFTTESRTDWLRD